MNTTKIILLVSVAVIVLYILYMVFQPKKTIAPTNTKPNDAAGLSGIIGALSKIDWSFLNKKDAPPPAPPVVAPPSGTTYDENNDVYILDDSYWGSNSSGVQQDLSQFA